MVGRAVSRLGVGCVFYDMMILERRSICCGERVSLGDGFLNENGAFDFDVAGRLFGHLCLGTLCGVSDVSRFRLYAWTFDLSRHHFLCSCYDCGVSCFWSSYGPCSRRVCCHDAVDLDDRASVCANGSLRYHAALISCRPCCENGGASPSCHPVLPNSGVHVPCHSSPVAHRSSAFA